MGPEGQRRPSVDQFQKPEGWRQWSLGAISGGEDMPGAGSTDVRLLLVRLRDVLPGRIIADGRPGDNGDAQIGLQKYCEQS